MVYTKDQVAQAFIDTGIKMGVTPRGIQIAIATGLVESNLTVLANPYDPASEALPHDGEGTDHDSEGDLQQRPAWWGTVEQRMSPWGSVTMFYTALQKYDYNNTANTPGWYAWHVQQCAEEYRGRYDERFDEAVGYFNRLVGKSTAAPLPDVAPWFTEYNVIRDFPNWQGRSGQHPRLFVLHTVEGAMQGGDLEEYLKNNEVSYHYIVDNDRQVWDLVDTDDASWSVGNANDFTINLVFGGSTINWSRLEWLQNMGEGIKIAAFLAVQDCRKYNIPIQMLVGNKYYLLPTTDGITDHNGINVGLGITTHTDVGKYFPWDVFWQNVQDFAAGMPVIEGDDDLTPEQWSFMQALGEKVDRIEFELTNKWDSRSPYASKNEKAIDTLVGYTLGLDGYANAESVEQQAILGDENAIARITRAAAGEGMHGTEQWAVDRATRALNQIPTDIAKAYEEAHK